MALLSDNPMLHFQMNNVDFKVAILVFLSYLSLIYLIKIYDETQKWEQGKQSGVLSQDRGKVH